MSERRAIVIGSGFGGLAIANRLQAGGLQTTILEKREKIGGRAYQLTEAGYTFDMGPSLITAPDVIESVFRAAGRSMQDYLDLVPLDPFYRIYFHDGTHIDYTGDSARMKDQMRRFDASDADRYDEFMEAIRPIYEAVLLDGLGARPFDTLRSMLSFAPRAARMNALRPVANFARRYFRDFRHQFLFSFHPLFLGGDPFRTPSIYLMIPYLERAQGVWFSRGGMYSLVEALARVFQENGGEIMTSRAVDSILVEGGVARGVTAGNESFPAEIVVSNADVAHTYEDLLRNVKRRRWTDRRLRRSRYTMSCFLLYLGVRRTYPQLAHHTLILTSRYRELLHDIFRRKVLADDFSMYLHAPTRTDPSMAPPGCESLYVLVPVPNLQGTTDWDEMTPVMTDRLLTFLESWGLEGLRDNLDVLRTFTPLDFERELNAKHGNAFGIEPVLQQTAWFRPHNRSEEVDGLYLVGAGTHPGAGVPGVLLSAEATAHSIQEDLTKAQRPLRTRDSGTNGQSTDVPPPDRLAPVSDAAPT